MKHIILLAFLVFVLPSLAFAKTPPEVLKPYKDYRAALKAGEKDKAAKYAYDAWQKAEELLGDHKTTGDLAANYADIVTRKGVKNPYENYKTRREAFQRSIKLAKLYDEYAADVELERLVKLTAHGLTLIKRRSSSNLTNVKSRGGDNSLKRGGEISDFNKLKDAISKYQKQGSVYEAEYYSLLAQRYSLQGKPEKSVEVADKAISIFEARDDKLFSPYEYAVRFYKGDSYKDLGQEIPAALEYQHVMQNLEGKIPADHAFVKRAFQNWMLIRSDIEDEGRLDEAEQAGLCECWPYENYKNKAVALTREPAKMPRRAKRSGHVIVQYDLDPDGHPINIKPISYTEDMFIDPSITAVKKWRYNKLADENSDIERTNLTTRLSFKLTNSRGSIIPERKLE